MNRYYLAPMSSEPLPNGKTRYWCPLEVYLSGAIRVRPKKAIITPIFSWAMVKADLSSVQHAEVMSSVAGVVPLPIGLLDRPVSELTQAQRSAVASQFAAMGLSSAWIAPTNTVREIIQYIAHTIQLADWAQDGTAADENAVRTALESGQLDIRTHAWSDLPVRRRNLILQHLADLGITQTPNLATPLWQVVRYVQRQNDQQTPRTFGRLARRWFYHDAEAE